MGILEQIMAKDKTQRVIESCVTDTHFSCAEKMLQLYYKKYEDYLGYNQLKRMINQNKDENNTRI